MLVHHGFYGSGSAYITFDIGLSWLLGIAALSKLLIGSNLCQLEPVGLRHALMHNVMICKRTFQPYLEHGGYVLATSNCSISCHVGEGEEEETQRAVQEQKQKAQAQEGEL